MSRLRTFEWSGWAALAIWLALGALGCERRPSPWAEAEPRSGEGDAGGALQRDEPEPDPGPPITSQSEELRACADAARASGLGYPQSIEAAVEHINTLPRPVSVACFVASLPRPLSVVATSSVFSAQPAAGMRSPRIFILGEPLILSVVPAGRGGQLLEFGEQVGAGRSIKGELAFPIDAPLTQDAPYARVLFDEQVTTCGLCHRAEWPHMGRPGAFESSSFRVQPETEVMLPDVVAEYDVCDAAMEPSRCQLLDALFGFGLVAQGAFPSDLPTFF